MSSQIINHCCYMEVIESLLSSLEFIVKSLLRCNSCCIVFHSDCEIFLWLHLSLIHRSDTQLCENIFTHNLLPYITQKLSPSYAA